MPPGKRKASTKATAPAVKKVRMDESSIIAEPEDQLPSRPKRKSIGTPQYNFTRPCRRIKKETDHDGEVEDTVVPDPQPTKRRGRPPKTSVASLPKPEIAPTARAAGRPSRTKSQTSVAKAAVDEAKPAPAGRKRGRPPKSAVPGIAKPASTSKKAASAKVPSDAIGTDTPKKRGRPLKIRCKRNTPSPEATIEEESSGTDYLDNEDTNDEQSDRQYWLMKAEPNDRYENGVNVSYSIDDLAATDVPEAWDGIRNFAARNNMRAMRKNDLAFFYHSNCPVPGVVGIMRIVQEHSPDKGAFDPNHAYYDPKSSPTNPRWDVVHVEFVKKFDTMVTLKMMQGNKNDSGELQNMQLLRMGRLSVSKVSAKEWKCVLEMANEDVRVGEDGVVGDGVAEGYESDTDGEVDGGPKEELNGDVVATTEMDVDATDGVGEVKDEVEEAIE